MLTEIGTIKAIFRYPVKSMAGESVASAQLGWHGFEHDRRFAFLRVGNESGFPWLTASKLPELICYRPIGRAGVDSFPTHVITPQGRELELRSEQLQQELSNAFGSPVQIMQLKQGIFDEAGVSVISTATIKAIEQEIGDTLDVRRFRPNLLIETHRNIPFEEDQWVGRQIQLAAGGDAPVISISMQDLRCMMIDLDPETGRSGSGVLKAVTRMNESCAGIYASVVKTGTVSMGDRLFLSGM